MIEPRTYTCPLCGRETEYIKRHVTEECPDRGQVMQKPMYPVAS